MRNPVSRIPRHEDTNGDGVSDTKELFYAGYGRVTNMEWQPGGMAWPLDNWLYTTYNPFRLRIQPDGSLVREETDPNGGQGPGQNPKTTIVFAPVVAKFVRVTQTGTPTNAQLGWAIQRLTVSERDDRKSELRNQNLEARSQECASSNTFVLARSVTSGFWLLASNFSCHCVFCNRSKSMSARL